MLIDTHAHVNFNAYKSDADEVIRRSLDNETWMILVGSDYKTSKLALDYANKYERGVYAAIGLHPIHLHEIMASDDDYEFKTRGEDFNFDAYEKLAKFEKVIAIGEVGLDYYHIDHEGDVNAIKERQKKVFAEQIKLARFLDIPVIIHCRQAHDDMIVLIKDLKNENKGMFSSGKPWGVMHCFSGDEDLAWQYFGLGLIISFTGLITFSGQWDVLLRKMPLDKFMIETDSPYMTPEPFRGKRNEPSLVVEVARRIAEIKGLSLDKVANITTNTARELFKI